MLIVSLLHIFIIITIIAAVERELKKLKPVTGASEGIQKMVDMSTGQI